MTARLLLRGSGVAGATAVAGGSVAVVATWLPWYAASTDLEMLGATQRHVVATLAGVPMTLPGWLALSAGAAALALGAGVALDRPRPRARIGLAVSAVLLAVAGVVGVVARPGAARIAGSEAIRLAELAERLPVGVALELSVGPAIGPAMTLVAAAMVAAGALGARDR